MKRKKIYLVATALFAIAASATMANAQSIPFGVKAREASETGVIRDVPVGQYGLDKDGNLLQSYEYKVGNRTGVEIKGIEYSLRFWNVGKLGGTTGFLFWKKDYAKALLTLTPVASKAGFMVADTVDNSKFGLPDGFKIEPATSDPDFRSISCQMVFAGGPTGEFEGSCGDGERIKGRLIRGQVFVFSEETEPGDQEVLKIVRSKEIPVSAGVFSDWPLENLDCEDSYGQFLNIDGTVEIKKFDTGELRFAKYDSPLCIGDLIMVGEESQARIGWPHKTYFLGPETQILVEGLPGAKDKSALQIIGGKIKANFQKALEGKDIYTEDGYPNYVMGIKGTTIEVEASPELSTFRLLEGEVELTYRPDPSKKITVQAGEEILSKADGSMEKRTFDATSSLAQYLQEEENWKKTRDAATQNPETEPNVIEKSGKKNLPWYAVGIIAVASMAGFATIRIVKAREKKRSQ